MRNVYRLQGGDSFFMKDLCIIGQVDYFDINGYGQPDEMLWKWLLVTCPTSIYERKQYLYFNTEEDAILYFIWGYEHLICNMKKKDKSPTIEDLEKNNRVLAKMLKCIKASIKRK